MAAAGEAGRHADVALLATLAKFVVVVLGTTLLHGCVLP